MKATHQKFGNVTLIAQDEFSVYTKNGEKLNKKFAKLTDEEGNVISDFSSLPVKQVEAKPTLKQIEKIITKPSKKQPKFTTIMCGISKETEKAIEIAIANKNGLHFIFIPKSQATIISKSDVKNSYGYINCFAAQIELPNWIFKNFSEKGIDEVKDNIGDFFSTKLRYLTA